MLLYSIGSSLLTADCKWLGINIFCTLLPHLATAKPRLKISKVLFTIKQMSYLTLKKIN